MILYIESCYDTSLVEVSEDFDEFLAVVIKNYDGMGENMLIANVYRSPNSSTWKEEITGAGSRSYVIC